MIDEIISVIGQMLGMLLRGLWTLTKILAKAFYHFLKKHPRYACLLPIILVAAYLRFSYIFSSNFLSIDPLDTSSVANLMHGTLILLGRPLAPANITFGPFYDYLIAPSFFILGTDPLGPALLAGVIFIATVYMTYVIGKQFFNLQAGIFAAGLYAVSAFVNSYVHQSWNSDILPFFSLLLLWLIFNAAARARPLLYYLAAGFVLGLCLQLHYIAVFLVVLVLFYMIITEVMVKGKAFVVPFLLHFLELLVGFVISMLAFLYSEALTGFAATKTLWAYLLQSVTGTGFTSTMSSIPQTFLTFFARLLVNLPSADVNVYYSSFEIALIDYFGIFLLVASCLVLLFLAKNRFIMLILVMWLLLGAFSLGIFRNDIYEYHFSLLYPVCFLLVGNFLATIFHFAQQERIQMAKQLVNQSGDTQTYTMVPVDVTDKKKLYLHVVSISISVIIFFIIVFLHLSVLPFRSLTAEKQSQIKAAATSIVQNANKKPFNFTLLTVPNTPAAPLAYENAMRQLGNGPVQIQHAEIDPQRKSVTEFLYVVCEDPQCKPLESTLWQVKGFGNAAILDHWNIQNTTVYKLVHVVEY